MCGLLVIGAGMSVSGCSDLTPLSIRFVTNAPPAPARVTSGDYVLSGGVNAHLADQAGFCGNVSSSGGQQLFLAVLLADDGVTQSFVRLSVRPAQASTGTPAHTGTFDLSRAGLVVQLGVNPATLSQGLDPKARTFRASSLRVTVSPDSAGSVTAVLQEVKVGASSTGSTTLQPVSGAPTVNLKGRFQCVAPAS